jgi:hypothetical protein
MGTCKIHPKTPLGRGKLYCDRCLDRRNYAILIRKENGFCTGHPTRQVIPGSTKCIDCLNKAKQVKIERQNNQVCRSHPNQPVLPATNICQTCSSRNRTIRQNRISQNKCPRHPTIDLAPNRSMCQLCLWTALERSIIRLYQITLEDYARTELKQNRTCAICKQKCPTGQDLAIDHNHKTNRFRGLLCTRCNQGIGHFLDNSELLVEASNYLRANP